NRLVLLLHRSVPRLPADRRHLLVAHKPVALAARAIMLPTGRESAGFEVAVLEVPASACSDRCKDQHGRTCRRRHKDGAAQTHSSHVSLSRAWMVYGITARRHERTCRRFQAIPPTNSIARTARMAPALRRCSTSL